MNAQLPSAQQEATIEDMQPGDSGWTVPWAMYADASSNLWLNGSYTLKTRPGGTVQMSVWRDDEGCWRIDASGCHDHKWSRGSSTYVGSFQPIAVTEATF